MADKLFYQLVGDLHTSLTSEQRSKVEGFMSEHDALIYYREMVDPEDPSSDPAQRDEYAVAQALALFQVVPKDQFAQLEPILGSKGMKALNEAIVLVKKRFSFLGALFG